MELTKHQMIDRLDHNFKYNLVLNITNNITKEIINITNINDIIYAKFNKESLFDIYEKYMLCYDLDIILKQSSLNNLRSIKNLIKTQDLYDNYYDEVHYGRKYCDIVGIKDNIITAIEIKSFNDDLRTVEYQLNYYKNCANNILLVVDEKHTEKAQNILSKHKWFGLWEYKDNEFNMIKTPPLLDINMFNAFNLMTYKYLSLIAKDQNIKQKGKKEHLISNLLDEITDDKKKLQYLKSYIVYRNNYVKNGNQAVLFDRANLS